VRRRLDTPSAALSVPRRPSLGPVPPPVARLGAFLCAPGRTDLLEITYAYVPAGSGKYLNRTVFCDYGGAAFGPRPTRAQLRAAVEAVRAKLDADVAAVRGLATECRALGRDPRAKIAAATARAAVRLLRFTREGLIFEAEKAGLPTGLTAKEVEAAVVRLEKLEAPLYGGTVRSKPREVREGAACLERELRSAASKATPAQRALAMRVLNMMRRLAPAGAPVPAPVLSAGPAPRWPVPRERYVAALRVAMGFYGLGLSVEVDAGFGSVYDGECGLKVPASREYAALPAQHVLDLILHEIETHFLTLFNGRASLGGLRTPGYLSREEGLAVFMEHLGRGRSPGAIVPDPGYSLLAAEILPGGEYRALVEAVGALRGGRSREWAESFALRAKRGYPRDGRGRQHKDVTYNRGLMEILRRVRRGDRVTELFSGKVGFRDAAAAARLAGGERKLPRLPAFLAEAVVWILSGKPFSAAAFGRSVRKKYAPVTAGYGSRRPWEAPEFASAAREIAALLAPPEGVSSGIRV